MLDQPRLADGSGLSGTLRKDWRLEMRAPYAFESASTGGEPLLVTRNPSGQGAGLELRTPRLNMEAVARTSGSRGTIAATGWNARFDHVQGTLVFWGIRESLLAAPDMGVSGPGS